MEAADAADSVREALDEDEDASRPPAPDRTHIDRFRRRAALLVGVLAALLAITSLGGQNATKTSITSNIDASDAFAFYQAKNIRQTDYQLAVDELEALLAVTTPTAEQRAQIQQRIDRYKATIARYESEPETGDGKKELLAKARASEQERRHAQDQDPNFDYAEALFQIGIVLTSVAIVAVSRPLLLTSVVLGGVATLLMLNGYLLWFTLPVG